MRKFLRRIFAFILIIPAMFVLVGCQDDDKLDSLKIKDISQTAFTAETVTYAITYEDGSTFDYTVPLNKDAISITSIEKTATNKNVDTYTIHFSNDTTTTFEVTNGVSIESVVFDSRDGLKDKYKINYSNGTSEYFTITNGKDGADGVSLEDMFEEANKDGKYKDILEFIDDYLSVETNTDSTAVATGKAILSAVSVYSQYPIKAQYYGREEKGMALSAGSGVIYTLDKSKGDAYIITNCHVVYSEDSETENNYASKIVCYLYGKESSISYEYQTTPDGDIVYSNGNPVLKLDNDGYPMINYGEYALDCELIGASIKNDLAVLKVTNSNTLKNSDARAIERTDTNDVALGEGAIAIGNPDMGGIAVTSGIISVINENIQVEIDSDIETTLREFRIDTPVNPGNSGGGLFNRRGELIGIVNAKSNDDEIENIGYAIPANLVLNIADNMIENYKKGGFGINRFSLGIAVGVKSSRAVYDSEKLTTKIVEDIKVMSVEDNSLAKRLGFKEGDIIISCTIFDGINTDTYNFDRYYELVDLMFKVKVGDSLTFNCISTSGNTTYTHTAANSDFTKIQ